MTDIIHILKEKGFKFGVYPVTEKSWLDVGQQEFLLRQLQAHNF